MTGPKQELQPPHIMLNIPAGSTGHGAHTPAQRWVSVWCAHEWAAAEKTGQHRRNKREREVERIKGRDAREESAAKITDPFTSTAALSGSQLIHCFLSVHSCPYLQSPGSLLPTLSACLCKHLKCNRAGKSQQAELRFPLQNLSSLSELQPAWRSSRCLLFSSCPVTSTCCLNGPADEHVSKVTVHQNFLNVNQRVRHLGENTSYNIKGSVCR